MCRRSPGIHRLTRFPDAPISDHQINRSPDHPIAFDTFSKPFKIDEYFPSQAPVFVWRLIQCRSGGIGRRAWFRSMYSQGCGGSSPFFGTSPFKFNHIAVWCPPWCPKNLEFGVHVVSIRADLREIFLQWRITPICRCSTAIQRGDESTSSKK
jgi:hypothetical protein